MGGASIKKIYAAVVELADTRDLKSLDGNIVPVQVRSAAPNADMMFNGSIPAFQAGCEGSNPFICSIITGCSSVW